MTTADYQVILNIAGSVFIVWAALVGTASVIVHLRVFDRHSTLSVHLLLYMLIIGVVLDLSCIRIFTGDSWWFQLLRLVVFIGVPLVMTQRLLLQLRAQRIGRPGGATSRPDDKPDSPDDREDQRTS